MSLWLNQISPEVSAAGTEYAPYQLDLTDLPSDIEPYKWMYQNAYQAHSIPANYIITYTTSGVISPSKGMVLLYAADITQSCSMTLEDVGPGVELIIMQLDGGTAGHYIQTPSSGVQINLATNVYSTNSAGVTSLERLQLNAANEGVRLFSASSTLWIAEPIGDVSGTSI